MSDKLSLVGITRLKEIAKALGVPYTRYRSETRDELAEMVRNKINSTEYSDLPDIVKPYSKSGPGSGCCTNVR